MTGPTMLELLRRLTGVTSSDQISDEEMYEYLSFGRTDVEDFLTSEVDPYYFWDWFYVNTEVDQNEYTMPYQDVGSGLSLCKQVLAVEFKRDNEENTDYIPVSIKSWRGIKETPEQQERGSTSSPYCAILENSLFIFPAPEVAVTNGIVLEGLKRLFPITTNTTEVSTFDIDGNLIQQGVFHTHSELVAYHRSVVLGAIPRVKRHRNINDNEGAILADNDFNRELLKIKKRIKPRHKGVYEAEVPVYMTHLSE